MYRFLLILLSLTTCPLLEGAKLQYQPEAPVVLTSVVTLDMEQSLPGDLLSIEAKQTLESDLTIVGKPESSPLVLPPFDLKLALRSFQMDLKINDSTVSYQSEGGEDSATSLQLKRLLNKPISLRYEGEKLHLTEPSQATEEWIRSLPILERFHPKLLLSELLRNLFVLSNRELEDGQTFAISSPFTDGDPVPLPKSLSYLVEKIDEQEIRARYEGDIDPQELTLGATLNLRGVEQQLFLVNVSGHVKGRVSWNRQNAALYHVEEKTSYKVQIKLGEITWDFTLFLTHRLHTQSAT